MSILDKIFGRQSGGKKPETSPSDKWAVFYYVRCAKCGEVIRVRLDRRNDFEQQFDENGHDEVAGYRVHKEVMGSGNCFKMMALEIKFDRGYREIEKSVRGGEFVTRENYEQSRGAPSA
jgi:hypothetical protein